MFLGRARLLPSLVGHKQTRLGRSLALSIVEFRDRLLVRQRHLAAQFLILFALKGQQHISPGPGHAKLYERRRRPGYGVNQMSKP